MNVLGGREHADRSSTHGEARIATVSLEDRVTRLESLVAKLAAQRVAGARKKDWRRTLGMFTGDEVMKRIDAEAIKYREADRKKARRRWAKRRLTKP